VLIVEDQSAEPEERNTSYPEQFKRCLERRRLDRRVAREGHDDEDEIQKQAEPTTGEEHQLEQECHDFYSRIGLHGIPRTGKDAGGMCGRSSAANNWVVEWNYLLAAHSSRKAHQRPDGAAAMSRSGGKFLPVYVVVLAAPLMNNGIALRAFELACAGDIHFALIRAKWRATPATEEGDRCSRDRSHHFTFSPIVFEMTAYSGEKVVPARALDKPLGLEISVDCMSQKDTGTKQTQGYRDHFNHLTHPLHCQVRLVVAAGFKIVSSARRNGFMSIGATKTAIRC
jgi:hypothetical protein